MTTTRVVRFRSLDHTRLAALDQLVRIARREVAADEAYGTLETLLPGVHAYPCWVATVGWAGMVASLVVLVGIRLELFDTDFEFFGAGFGLAAIAAAVTALVDRIGRVLNRRSLPFFFQQVVGAGGGHHRLRGALWIASGRAVPGAGTGCRPDGAAVRVVGGPAPRRTPSPASTSPRQAERSRQPS